ncbi:MAG: lysozyme inhibitor LprI family protein, partial [Burkholderiales bacterium]|nr:lysozyme inhibitor LprI family protein [Burkholderiales bacterium]
HQEFIDGLTAEQSNPKNADPAWRLTTYEAIKAYLTVRIYELAASVLPKPKYSKEIRSFCAKAKTFQEGSECAKRQLEADEKVMQASFAKALARSREKEELENSQKEWAENRNEVCAFGAVFGASGETYELECQDNWTRIRNAELIKMVAAR